MAEYGRIDVLVTTDGYKQHGLGAIGIETNPRNQSGGRYADKYHTKRNWNHCEVGVYFVFTCYRLRDRVERGDAIDMCIRFTNGVWTVGVIENWSVQYKTIRKLWEESQRKW